MAVSIFRNIPLATGVCWLQMKHPSVPDTCLNQICYLSEQLYVKSICFCVRFSWKFFTEGKETFKWIIQFIIPHKIPFLCMTSSWHWHQCDLLVVEHINRVPIHHFCACMRSTTFHLNSAKHASLPRGATRNVKGGIRLVQNSRN